VAIEGAEVAAGQALKAGASRAAFMAAASTALNVAMLAWLAYDLGVTLPNFLGEKMADRPVADGRAQTRPTRTAETMPPARQAAYGVFLAGNDIFVGPKPVLGALKRRNIRGWGLSDEPVGESAFRDVLNKEFKSAEEARAAYLGNMIPGSEHLRPLGL
jgi:hypothetical protein